MQIIIESMKTLATTNDAILRDCFTKKSLTAAQKAFNRSMSSVRITGGRVIKEINMHFATVDFKKNEESSVTRWNAVPIIYSALELSKVFVP